MAADPHETRIAIQSALDALKRGDRVTARRQADLAASLSPDLEAPWLILAALSAPDASVAYARKALHANPSSTRAREALIWTLQRQQSLADHGQGKIPGPQVSPVVEPQPVSSVLQEIPREKPAGPPQPSLPVAIPPAAGTGTASSPQEITHELKSVRVSPPEAVPPHVAAAPPQPPVRVASPVPLPPKPAGPSSPPKKRRKPTSSSDRVTLFFLAGWLVLAVITGISFLHPNLAGLFAGGTHPAPTPRCVQPMLQLGTLKFPIRSVARPADGSLPLPAQADIAWWLEGTSVNYVFDLNPTEGSLISLNNIVPGSAVTITWADCSTEDYQVSAVTSQAPLSASLLDQSQGGITILIPASSSAATLLIQGQLQGVTITSFSTPDANAIQAEISFLDQTTSADGNTLTMTIDVKNTGSRPIDVTGNDVTLTVPDIVQEIPLITDPALPQQIAPGADTTLILTFSKPQGKTAVFKVLDFSVDISY